MGFINDPKYRIGNKSGKKILLKKEIDSKNIIINVFNYLMFMNSMSLIEDFDEIVFDSVKNEKETIITPIKIQKENIIEL